jgi:phage terminase large subunit-like protein
MLPNRTMNLCALRGHREHGAEQDHEGHLARQDHQAGRLESGLHSRSFDAKCPAKLHRSQGHTRKDRTTRAASISGAMAVQFSPSSLLHTVRALFTAAQNSQGAIGFERAPAPLLHTMRALFTVA